MSPAPDPGAGPQRHAPGVLELIGQLEDVLRAHGLDPLERAELALAVIAGTDDPTGTCPALVTHPAAAKAAVALVASYSTVERDTLRAGALEHFGENGLRRSWAQHHTPPPIAHLIAELVAPPARGIVLDPAVGGGELLWAVHDRSTHHGSLWPALAGIDRSPHEVRATRLQAQLHGADARTLILEGDFLTTAPRLEDPFEVVVCNPPFGSRVTEDRSEVLRGFDLGQRWTRHPDGAWHKDQRLARQELGILFVEAAVRAVRPGTGRVAIVVPNGYLSNRSPRYLALRAWLMRHTRIAALIGLPRFAFKAMGSDVTATIVVAERRAQPLDAPTDSDDHRIAVELLDPDTTPTGTAESTVANTAKVLAAVASSTATATFTWLAAGHRPDPPNPGHTIAPHTITALEDLNLDPKRHSARHHATRTRVTALAHISLGDIVKLHPPTPQPTANTDPDHRYAYVDLASAGIGTYTTTVTASRSLPARARHHAQPGDLFVASIWGSASKWFIAGPEPDLMVSNGFHWLTIVDDTLALDLLTALCTETYTTQVRALARGSDGLAALTSDGLLAIVLPRVTNPDSRRQLTPLVHQLRAGIPTLASAVAHLVANHQLPGLDQPPRSSRHTLV